MSNSNSIIVGSSSETHIGLGTLLKWNREDVISFYFREEEGNWIVEERLPDGGFKCYEIMVFEADLLGSTIETVDHTSL